MLYADFITNIKSKRFFCKFVPIFVQLVTDVNPVCGKHFGKQCVSVFLSAERRSEVNAHRTVD